MSGSAAVFAVVALAALCVAFAVVASRAAGERQRARDALVRRRVAALRAALDRLQADTRADFAKTGGGVASAAARTMGVLGDAIRRESRALEDGNARGRRALASMQALLDANDRALRELAVKLDAEDGATLARFVRALEARHVEVVNYLSGGGLERVAGALDRGGREPFAQGPQAVADMGVVLSAADWDALRAGVRDDMARGLSRREALFARLSQIAPVVARARELKLADVRAAADSKRAALGAQLKGILDADASHRDATIAAMGARVAELGDNVRGQIERVSLTQAQGDALKKMVSDSMASVADARAALAAFAAATAQA